MISRFRRIVFSLLLLPASAWAQPAYQPLQYRDDIWYGSTFWTGPNWTRVGKDWHHPGEQTPAVRTFLAPADGKARVTGRVYKLDTKGGDGIHAEIRHNAQVVWRKDIAAADGKGAEHDLTLTLRKGDALRFVVDKGGQIYHDTTHWDPLVACEGGKKHQASAAFAAFRQAADGWQYEMELPAGVKEIKVPPGPKPWRPYPFVEGDLDAMVQADWRWEDQIDGAAPTYAAAIDKHLAGARDLLGDLRREHGLQFLAEQAQRLEAMTKRWAALNRGTGILPVRPTGVPPVEENRGKMPLRHMGQTPMPRQDAAARPAEPAEWEKLYLDLRRLKREISLANPLMNFGPLLLTKRVPTSYSHLVMQYYGWRARPGGGLFILEQPGRSLACRDILDGKLAGGNVLEPRLSYDAGRIVFSYVACGQTLPPVPQEINEDAGDEHYYHLWEVNVDGTGLRQITSGPYDDLMPEYLPDGGIVFSSTRRRGYARCFGGQFGKRWHVYTLHRVQRDGSGLRALSYHDTNEWFPRVGNDGLVYYARWDYIDRDAVTHQNLWCTRPDGTNPLAVWGNAAPKPHCTFQAQPVPHSPKFIFAASAHHSITGGCLTLLDPTVSDNDASALVRLSPEIAFPEAEGRAPAGYYTSPWALSERYFLVAYSPVPLVYEPRPNPANALGLYLMDAFGNRELLYRDVRIGCEDPIPLRARPVPPVVHSKLPAQPGQTGEVVLSDVYQGLDSVPRGTIRSLRVVQIFPKTTNVANSPPIGMAGEENARAILGTVKVEADGSARFLVPACTPLLFQALDADGMAYQTMRSLTYLQPGEKVSCVGCHEPRLTGPPNRVPVALSRPAQQLEAGELGGQPFSFVRFVQPVLDKHCVRCHGGAGEDGKPRLDGKIDLRGEVDPRIRHYSRSYVSLMSRGGLVPRYAARNQVQLTPPGGLQSARGSRLIKLLRDGHEKVTLTPAELRTIAAWIDCNAIFYGVNLPADQDRQLQGVRVAMPKIQ